MNAQQREAKRQTNRRWRARCRGEQIEKRSAGRPAVPRCPVCHEPISVERDCKCPQERKGE